MGDIDERVLNEKDAKGEFYSVIDLASVRVAKGWRKYSSPKCDHQHLVYSISDRLIECDDCNKPVEGFDAFVVLCRYFDEMINDAKGKLKAANDAMAKTVRRRAAQAMERSWSRSKAPCCPHCQRGLLPSDFERGVTAAVSAELEAARRRPPPPGSHP